MLVRDMSLDMLVWGVNLPFKIQLLTVVPQWFYLHLAKLRTGNYGCWLGLKPNDRECNLYNLHEGGDVFHYVLICLFFKTERQIYIVKYYYTSNNVLKFKELLNCKNEIQLRNIFAFLRKYLFKESSDLLTLKVNFMFFQNKHCHFIVFIIIMFLFSFSSFHSYVMCMTIVCLNKEYCIVHVMYCIVLLIDAQRKSFHHSAH